MKTQFLMGPILAGLFSHLAGANIVCQGQTSMGPARVEIGHGIITISGAALDTPAVYTSLQEQWDGHMTELITGPGIAVSFENWYGCIHNAKITANFRTSPGYIETIAVPVCSGGSTGDRACHAPEN